ncbi:XXYS1_4_G0020850.mRNA.1.CDS.1 [Saccharomyces cerevisiae]|nr:EM14S01-3B_G0018310.mRNA.1.CDS.1 [Saccharomyces cerevisiae]CAD6649707.1 XXYS1_4_G0020850.mRNA.1.CDS.1 [Saccharomyces cerevisiae]CAI4829846.1 CEI_1a_G0053940.mRNA.1.CDS.1 [Saccharomyces cerevisiae]CAI4835971.1 AMH_1a_G0054070.mRNA.1.CDS.1 [Saccharomyces cerevisiae]CAI6902818.1 AMH_1a_G0054070.mRNA.1.CDS.1 [Saccharomyces cerevisiae]
MLKRRSNVLITLSRTKLFPITTVAYYHRRLLNQQRRAVSTSPKKEIKSLEDLANLDSLDGVDTELIRDLINEHTTKLNIKKELDMLKKFSQEEESGHEVPVKRFIRPLWMFILMGSSVYLLLHFSWWKLEHEERESQLKKEVEILEHQLNELIVQDKTHNIRRGKGSNESTHMKPWYRRWFW